MRGGTQAHTASSTCYALTDGPFALSSACHTLTLGKLFKPSGPQISHKIEMRIASSWRADC